MTKEKYNQLREKIIKAVSEIKDITLEDVLVLISKELLGKYIDIKLYANYIVLIDNRLNNVGGDDRCIWQLNKPFRDQKDETIKFLWDLICK